MKELDIIILTETHERYNKTNWNETLNIHNKWRTDKEKKGGGISVIHKRSKKITLEEEKINNNDILYLKGKIGNETYKIFVVYLSVDNTEQNKKLMQDLEHKIEDEEDNLLIIGDFNAHTGYLGYQEENKNGKLINSFLETNNLVLFNLDEKCVGTNTWRREMEGTKQESAIDFIIGNEKIYGKLKTMEIDENRDKFDLSDHNLIDVEMKINQNNKDFKNQEWIEHKYFSTRKTDLKRYNEEIKKKIEGKAPEKIMELNELIRDSAERTLQKSYKKRTDQENEISEPPWMNEEIRKQIELRKKLNRKHRKAKIEEEKTKTWCDYKKQKLKCKTLVKVEITKYEEKLTTEIKNSRTNNENVWKYIDKLRDKRKEEGHIELYNEQGKKLNRSEGDKELTEFWKQIYQKHENHAHEIWNDASKMKYKNEYLKEDKRRIVTEEIEFDPVLREHIDAAVKVEREKEIKGMERIEITKEHVRKILKKLRNKKAPGIDELKPELYKALIDDEKNLEILAKCLNNTIQTKEIPEDWNISLTKMIPKTSRPTVKDLRPIALLNVSYKILMAIIREIIEDHINENNLREFTQAGFTKNSRIEDNLFILQYTIEDSYLQGKPLYVTAIDYTKAYDSIKREKIIEIMKKYKIHPDIIELIVKVYSRDKTIINTSGKRKIEIDVQSGIKQGCTVSTTIFKLITYEIIEELQKKAKGFRNFKFNLQALFFADDALLLSHTEEDTEANIKIIKEKSEEYGLDLNLTKCNIIIYNSKEQPTEIANIKVTDTLKYLGIHLYNNRNIWKKQKEEMGKRANRLCNQTYSIIGKSCNKLLIGKTYWKSVALPSILYGTAIIKMNNTDIQKLQRYENKVYRQILAAPKYTPICCLKKEIGASYMSTRIKKIKLNY